MSAKNYEKFQDSKAYKNIQNMIHKAIKFKHS